MDEEERTIALAEYLNSGASVILKSDDLREALSLLSLLGISLSLKSDKTGVGLLGEAFDILECAIMSYKEEEEKLLGGLL